MSAETPLVKESASTNGRCSSPGRRGSSLTRLLFRGLLFAAGADEDTGQAVVSLVTRGVKDHVPPVVGLPHLDEHGPGTRPRPGVIECDFALQIIRIDACEAFDDPVGAGIRSTKSLR